MSDIRKRIKELGSKDVHTYIKTPVRKSSGDIKLTDEEEEIIFHFEGEQIADVPDAVYLIKAKIEKTIIGRGRTSHHVFLSNCSVMDKGSDIESITSRKEESPSDDSEYSEDSVETTKKETKYIQTTADQMSRSCPSCGGKMKSSKISVSGKEVLGRKCTDCGTRSEAIY